MTPHENNKTSPSAKKKNWVSRMLDDDRVRRAVSIVIALFLWMYVTMVVQPHTTQKITGIPVDFSQGSLNYTQQGLSIVNDPEYYVTVVVSGDGAMDSYETLMRENARVLMEALEQ